MDGPDLYKHADLVYSRDHIIWYSPGDGRESCNAPGVLSDCITRVARHSLKERHVSGTRRCVPLGPPLVEDSESGRGGGGVDGGAAGLRGQAE